MNLPGSILSIGNVGVSAVGEAVGGTEGVGVGEGAGIVDELVGGGIVGTPEDGVRGGLEQAAAKTISASAASRTVRHQAMLHQVRGGPS